MKSEAVRTRGQHTGRQAHPRRYALALIGAAASLGLGLIARHSVAPASGDKYAAPANSALPPSDMQLDLKHAALVVSDPLRFGNVPGHGQRGARPEGAPS